MFERRRNKRPQIQTLISSKTRINGDVSFGGGLHLDGTINGNVVAEDASSDFLSVSEDACIEGNVAVPNIVLNGLVKGDIDCSVRIQVGPRARVLGNVTYATLETAIGAQINGKLIHRQESGPKAPGEAAGAPGAAEPAETPSL